MGKHFSKMNIITPIHFRSFNYSRRY